MTCFVRVRQWYVCVSSHHVKSGIACEICNRSSSNNINRSSKKWQFYCSKRLESFFSVSTRWTLRRPMWSMCSSSVYITIFRWFLYKHRARMSKIPFFHKKKNNVNWRHKNVAIAFRMHGNGSLGLPESRYRYGASRRSEKSCSHHRVTSNIYRLFNFT